MNKKISVFIPYYNDEKYLAQSIDSVLSQNYTNFELILFNHGSTDQSKVIAHGYKDERIKHMGVDKNYYYMNGGFWQKIIDFSTGDYWKTFCADDIMLPNCLEYLVNFLENNQDYIAAFGWMQPFNENGDISDEWYTLDTKLDRYQKIYSYFNGRYIFSYPTAMIRMESMRQITLDKVALQLLDVSTWIKLLLLGDIGLVYKKLVKYRYHKEQPSTDANPQVAKFRRREQFERQFILDIFTNISDLDLLKKIFVKSEEIQKLTDIKFVRFLVCLEAIKNKNDNPMHWRALVLLYEMMQNNDFREQIEKKFDFSIATLRQINCNYSISGSDSFTCRVLFKKFAKYFLLKAGLFNFVKKIKYMLR